MKLVVAEKLETIKRSMPNVLACIEDRAQHFGQEAYALVRRGLRGEPGCFYAIEAGYVVGTPLGMDGKLLQEAADFMALFGSTHVCMWPARVWGGAQGGGNGTA